MERKGKTQKKNPPIWSLFICLLGIKYKFVCCTVVNTTHPNVFTLCSYVLGQTRRVHYFYYKNC